MPKTERAAWLNRATMAEDMAGNLAAMGSRSVTRGSRAAAVPAGDLEFDSPV